MEEELQYPHLNWENRPNIPNPSNYTSLSSPNHSTCPSKLEIELSNILDSLTFHQIISIFTSNLERKYNEKVQEMNILLSKLADYESHKIPNENVACSSDTTCHSKSSCHSNTCLSNKACHSKVPNHVNASCHWNNGIDESNCHDSSSIATGKSHSSQNTHEGQERSKKLPIFHPSASSSKRITTNNLHKDGEDSSSIKTYIDISDSDEERDALKDGMSVEERSSIFKPINVDLLDKENEYRHGKTFVSEIYESTGNNKRRTPYVLSNHHIKLNSSSKGNLDDSVVPIKSPIIDAIEPVNCPILGKRKERLFEDYSEGNVKYRRIDTYLTQRSQKSCHERNFQDSVKNIIQIKNTNQKIQRKQLPKFEEQENYNRATNEIKEVFQNKIDTIGSEDQDSEATQSPGSPHPNNAQQLTPFTSVLQHPMTSTYNQVPIPNEHAIELQDISATRLQGATLPTPITNILDEASSFDDWDLTLSDTKKVVPNI